MTKRSQDNPSNDVASTETSAEILAPPRADIEPARSTSRSGFEAAFGFIFITVLLDVLAFSFIIPVLPKLIENFQGGNTEKAAYIVGVFGTCWAIIQFFAMPVMGALSDRVGRRPVILVSNLGLSLDHFLMALAPNLAWLFVGRLISGITAATFSTAFAYVADVTPPEQRAKRYGYLGIAFGLGFIIGPAIGGQLGALDPRAPFWAAGIVGLINTAYGFFVLPESLKHKQTGAISWAKVNPLNGLRFLRERPQIFGLASIKATIDFAHFVFPLTFVLYAGFRFHWDAAQVGNVLALVGLAGICVQGGLVGRVVKKWGERRTLIAGMFCGVTGMLAYGLAPNGALFLAAVPIASLWGLAGPALQSLMTSRVGPEEQGRLQGAVAGLSSLAGIVAPVFFTSALATGIRSDIQIPGLAFFLSASLLVVGLALSVQFARPLLKRPALETQQDQAASS